MSPAARADTRTSSFFAASPLWVQACPAKKSSQNINILTFMGLLLPFEIPKSA
jgi:hypothetical protein